MGLGRRTTVILNLPAAFLFLSLLWLNAPLVSAQSCPSTPITSGSPVNGSLTDSDCAAPHRQRASGGGPAKADLYTFTGTAGQSVTITMNRASLRDPYLILVGPDGTVVAENDDDGGNQNALITRSLPSSGTYTIEATAYRSSDRGTYTLTVTVSGDGGGVNPLTPGQMRTIDIPAGESIIVSVATGTVSAPSNGLAAVFGLEFRVGGSVTCYVGRSVNVGPSSDPRPEHSFNAQSGGLPNTGEVLRDTAQNTTYYMRLTNISRLNPSRVYVQADLKEIKVHPVGQEVSRSMNNYFISHGRASDYTQFRTLASRLAVRISDPNSRYFLVCAFR